MEQKIVALDVGGTSIKAGLVVRQHERLSLVEESLLTYPAHAQMDADTILNSLAEAVEKTCYFADTVNGVAMGFPGPFDYRDGISYMRGLGKYDDIYGVRLIPELKRRLVSRPGVGCLPGIQWSFLNDAWAFALGEARYGAAKDYRRVLCLTLGTGCGSAFLVDGCLVQGEEGAPENGMIFDQPFREGVVDDYVSRRYLMECARRRGLELDGAELFDLASRGNRQAAAAFEEYGSAIGQAIRGSVEQFHPDVLLFGGKISQALPYFETAMLRELPSAAPERVCSRELSRSALLGAAGDWLDRSNPID